MCEDLVIMMPLVLNANLAAKCASDLIVTGMREAAVQKPGSVPEIWPS